MENISEEFDFIKISLASPDLIKKWAEKISPEGDIIGEVTNTDTVNYRTFRPEMNGLFCERIFGPLKNGQCSCGKIKQSKNFGLICKVCQVEVTDSRVRRHRMGYIKLLTPVTHIWFLKSRPSIIALILDMQIKELEPLIYYNELFDYENNYLFLEEDDDEDDIEFDENNSIIRNRIKHGAEIIEEDLSKINLITEIALTKKTISCYKYKESLIKLDFFKIKRMRLRLRILESFLLKKVSPCWMLLSILPVIPPGLRPMILLESGKFATSDLNELYKRIIMRNNRLGRLFDMHAPSMILRNEKRLLQESVDALIDNGRRGKLSLDISEKPLQSLSDALKGKEGRFRENLLGKRVDYSGRSVITVGPELKLHQCGVPYDIAIELFKPFLIYELIQLSQAFSIRGAEKIIEKRKKLIMQLLRKIFVDHPIILNRAPTLHRLGVQAFEPILTTEKSITLHPLVCSAFNADFDGDQMAIHIPLSLKARAEAFSLLYAPCNFISPATGIPIIIPSQDMILGFYYLTTITFFGLRGSSHYFSNMNDALLAYEAKKIQIHSLIWLRFSGYIEEYNNCLKPLNVIVLNNKSRILIYRNKQLKENANGKIIVTYIRTTVGRIIFNKILNNSLNINY